jgi:hypothetical protein
MAKKSTADQRKANAGRPENLKPFPPGVSGNPAGRPRNAGASFKEWCNILNAANASDAELRRIAKHDPEPARRAAALWLIRLSEVPDLAEFEEFLLGKKTLAQLREEGKDTSMLKKAKISSKGVEIELHDRSGEAIDRIADRTDGKPSQAVEVSGNLPQAIQILFPTLPT